MTGIAEVTHLFAIRKPLIAWLALLALILGQSASGLHALKHLGSGSDATGGPAQQHLQLCLECASFTPLAAVHGAPTHLLLVAFVAAAGVLPILDAACAAARRAVPFQARAPPR
jgi:hypothetical protein